MENSPQTSQKRRWGLYRWLIILVIVVNVYAAQAFTPIMPHVQVPAENIVGPFTLPVVGELYLTNTIIATLIGDVILILLAFSVFRATRSGELVLKGAASIVEGIVEAIYSLTEATARKWTGTIFPWVATIILVVLVANFLELIPGVDSIGRLHEPHHGAPTYETQELFKIGSFGVTTITHEIEAEETHADTSHEDEHSEAAGVGFTPYVRVASTDLNFTLAIALTSVVVTQVIGLRAVGRGYLKKYFNFNRLGGLLFRNEIGAFDLIFPFTDVFVGILELMAEFAKIISFSFRLFGNIFAGAVLLFVMGSLIPVVVQSGFLFLELLVAVVQAMVFGLLTMVFMTMATVAHDDHDEEHGEEHE